MLIRVINEFHWDLESELKKEKLARFLLRLANKEPRNHVERNRIRDDLVLHFNSLRRNYYIYQHERMTTVDECMLTSINGSRVNNWYKVFYNRTLVLKYKD